MAAEPNQYMTESICEEGKPVVARFLIFLYGVAAYLQFFITILYAIGFVSGFVVPKAINTGAVVSTAEALLVNTGLLLLFVVQHTVMARSAFKQWLTRFLPAAMERSTYVLLSSAILLLLFWQWRPMPTVIWDVQMTPLRIAIYTVSFIGWFIVLYSSFIIDHFDLFGLRQVTAYLRGKTYNSPPFVVRSLYRVVRHPLMLGFLIAFWFTPTMTLGHLFFAVMTTGYIIFGTTIEERDLVRHHGKQYEAYRRQTPMLLPRLRVAERAAGHTASPTEGKTP